MHSQRELDSVTVSADTETSSFDLFRFVSFSYHVKVSEKSSPVGAKMFLQVSNDGSDWVDVLDSTLNITNNATGSSAFLEDADISYRYVRLKFEITSGSFVADVWFNGQEGAYA